MERIWNFADQRWEPFRDWMALCPDYHLPRALREALRAQEQAEAATRAGKNAQARGSDEARR